MQSRRLITVSLPFLPLFTLEQCWNCKTYGFPRRLGTIELVLGRFCRSCRRQLGQPPTPEDMGFEEIINAESIDERPDAGRGQLRGRSEAQRGDTIGPGAGAPRPVRHELSDKKHHWGDHETRYPPRGR